MAIRGSTRNLSFFCGFAVNLVFEWLSRFIDGMALHAGRIRIWLVQLRRSMARSAPIVGVIIPNVMHSADFREHRSEHAIIGMTHVTAFISEIGILAVNRSERRTVRIRRIVCVNGHGMTRGAEFAFRGDFEIGHIAGHRRRDGQWSEPEEKPNFDDAIEFGSTDQKNHENRRGKNRE